MVLGGWRFLIRTCSARPFPALRNVAGAFFSFFFFSFLPPPSPSSSPPSPPSSSSSSSLWSTRVQGLVSKVENLVQGLGSKVLGFDFWGFGFMARGLKWRF